MLIVGVYIDNIILAGKESSIQQVKAALASAFDLGKLNYFLRIKIERNSNNSIWIGQPAYIKN